MRRNLLSSIEDIYITDWVGESALVLINAKHHQAALTILQELHRKHIRTELYDKMLGDKETFWLSILLSGQKPQFSSYGMQIIGTRFEKKRQICPAGNDVVVQYISAGALQRPNIFYLNGQSIEKLLDSQHPKRAHIRKKLQFISKPIIGHQRGTCRPLSQCKAFNDSTFDILIDRLSGHRKAFLQQLKKHQYVFKNHIFSEEVLF
ncbi:hypothetical protein RFI_11855 [Reticulomyxa filosa]|uniref:Uncharacterized protein n=1 Tax=Reticulomyxa filosa TaxID=46433 RepID=X6NIV4_RETFI|nr:hypothetical protein RFI_11855 [Reticulomyxa filosa]|eukprot:ETO25282.1 hypothetical protein RFI_11855 [Reticulomyxa filosa]